MQTLTLTYAPVSTPDDWSHVARLTTLSNPDSPVTSQQCSDWASEIPTHVFCRRLIAWQDGAAVAGLRVIEPFWTKAPGVVDVRVFLPYSESNAALYESVFDHGIDIARAENYTIVRTWQCSDNRAFEDVLRRMGFSSGQRNPETKLDVDAFDPAPFQAAIKSAREAGYVIVSLPEFKAMRPDTWIQDYWRFEQDIMADVPLPDPWEDVPLETYSKMILSPTFRPEGYFLVLHGEDIACTTQLNWNFVDAELAHTGITGTGRKYRRRGLATAVKAHSIEWARSVGIRRIMTDNEEKNPMLDLNVALGYQKAYEWVEWSRSI